MSTDESSTERRRRIAVIFVVIAVLLSGILAIGGYFVLRDEYRKYYEERKNEERSRFECRQLRIDHQDEHPPRYNEKEKETLRQCEAFEGGSAPATP